MNRNDDKDPSENLSSPYYLHPDENPGLVLFTPPLNGTNYHLWSRGMQRALLLKNKVKFINGDITKPTKNEPIFDAWERCNMMVISWITNTLTPQIGPSIDYIDNAQELWEDLRQRFSKGENFRIFDLLQEVNSIKQGERSITDYYTDLKVLWEELEFLRPVPSCTCNIKCSCHVNKIDTDYRELEYVMCFLKGLGELYTNVRTQILLMEPLPNINKVFSIILHHERQLSGSRCSIVKIRNNNTDQQQWNSHHAIQENDLNHHQIVANRNNDSLTDGQIQQLLKFLQTSGMKINQTNDGEPCTRQSKKGKITTISLMIDIRPIDHVMNIKNIYIRCHEIIHIHVKLLNNTYVIVNYA